MSENRETPIMLYFTDEEFRRNDLITSRTCKSAFEWLNVELWGRIHERSQVSNLRYWSQI